MQKIWVLLLFVGLLSTLLVAYNPPEPPAPPAPPPAYPKGYFQRPIAENMLLTGTFGELRPDHYHSGIDIKSNTGIVGQSVLAAADGFVDRISIGPSGYGNVMYIKHPNGYSTVYAHLDRFSPEIQRYVREQQYKYERFEVNLYPPNNLLKVKKGQEIAKLGNSGSSSGPHLHFEIRAPGGKPVNPLLCDLPIPDGVAPDIRDMKIYFLGENREVLGSKPLPIMKHRDGSYSLKGGDTLRIGAWRASFGVKTYDQIGAFRNDNGIYRITLMADGQTAFQNTFNEFAFGETRYLNAHCDYAARKRFGAWFHRLFSLPGDKFSAYTPTITKGAVALFAEKAVKLVLKIEDAAGNSSSLSFWVLRDANKMESFPQANFNMEMPWDAESKFTLDDVYLNMPANALYEPLKFRYLNTPDYDEGAFSPMHHFHDDRTPVHRYFEIGIRPVKAIPEYLRSKAVVANCGEGRPDNCGAEWKGDKLSTRVREFGNYCILIDTIAPTITPVQFDADMRRKDHISFRIRDNFATAAQANGLYYRGTVDGQWVLFEFDKKRDRLTYTFDEKTPAGEHTLRLVVRDDRGNEAVFERKFIR